MRFLLDTNVVSEAGKERPHPKVLNWLLQHELDSGVPTIVLAERYQGAMLGPRAKRKARLAELDAFVANEPERILDFNAEAAKAWGDYASRPEVRQKPPSYPDSQIAAIALANHLTVVTRDTDHFPGIDTLNPFEG